MHRNQEEIQKRDYYNSLVETKDSDITAALLEEWDKVRLQLNPEARTCTCNEKLMAA